MDKEFEPHAVQLQNPEIAKQASEIADVIVKLQDQLQQAHETLVQTREKLWSLLSNDPAIDTAVYLYSYDGTDNTIKCVNTIKAVENESIN